MPSTWFSWKTHIFCVRYFVIPLASKEDTVCSALTAAAAVKDAQFSRHDKIQVYWNTSFRAAQLKEQEQPYSLLRDLLASFEQMPIGN